MADKQEWDSPEVQLSTPRTKRPDAFKSDRSCFVPWADAPTGQAGKPKCFRCDQESIGGNFLELFSGGPVGRTAGIVQFTCGCDGTRFTAISSATLFPQWRLVSETQPGVWRVVKTTRKEREKLCTE